MNRFYIKDQRTGRRYTWCKDCHMAMTTAKREPISSWLLEKARREADPEQAARYDLRRAARRHGLDPDEIEAHFVSHNGLCDSCGRGPEESIQPRKRLSIDHDHATGKFRGLLCHDCNLMIGLANDDVKRLLNAVAYLERG